LQARSATGTGSHAQAMSDLLGQPAHAIVQSVQSKRRIWIKALELMCIVSIKNQ
jgi:hypothetical protein